MAGQAATKAEVDDTAGLGHGDLGASDLAESRVDRALHLRLRGVAGKGLGGIDLTALSQAQRVAIGLGRAAQRDPLDFGDRRNALLDGLDRDAGVAQRTAGQAQTGDIGRDQRALETDLETRFARVRLGRIERDGDVAPADIAQRLERGLDSPGHQRIVCAVADRSAGLPAEADGEAAAGLAGGRAQLGADAPDVLALQRAAEADVVDVGACAARAATARGRHADARPSGCERSVERVLHLAGTGVEVQRCGGVSHTAVRQRQLETARAVVVYVDLLDLAGGRSAVLHQRVAELALAVLETLVCDVLVGQRTDESDDVALACAAELGVALDLDVGLLGSAGLVVVDQLGVGIAQPGDGCGGVAGTEHAGHAKALAVSDVIKGVGVGDLGRLEDDRVDLRARCRALDQRGRRGACGGRAGCCAVERQALDLVAAGLGRSRGADVAVGGQEDAVIPALGRAGEDDLCDLGQAGKTGVDLLDVHADRRGLGTRGLDRQQLELVGAGVGRAERGHAGGHHGGAGRDLDAGHVGAGQGADEFDLEAVDPVAGQAHIACAHAVERLERGRQLEQQLGVAVARSDADVGAVAAFAQEQRAHQVHRQRQQQLGVGQRVGLGLVGHRDAAVDVDRQVTGLDRQAVDADELSQGGSGLQAGEAALGLGRGGRIGDQGQREIRLSQRQAHAVGALGVDAGESVYVLAAEGHDLGSAELAAVRQCDLAAGLAQTEAALNPEETEQIEREVAAGLQGLALAAQQAQFQAGVAAGGDRQIGLLVRIVDHQVAGLVGTVDRHVQAAADGRDAFYALERELGRVRLQAGPAARRIRLVAHQREAELGPGQGQADAPSAAAVDADEGVDVVAANGQQVDRDHLAVGQCDAAAGLLERKVTVHAEEAEDLELEVTGCARELTQRAVGVDRHGRAWTAEDFELLAAEVDHQVVLAAGACDAAVDLDAQVGGAGSETAESDELDAGRRGLEGAEVTRRGAGGGRLLGHQRQAEVHPGQLQAHRVGRAAVQARKGLDA